MPKLTSGDMRHFDAKQSSSSKNKQKAHYVLYSYLADSIFLAILH